MIPLPDDIRMVFTDRPGFLQVTVTGPRDSRDISLAYWLRIADECRARRAMRLLVIEKLGDHEGERDLPGLVDQLIAIGMDRLKVAYVVSHFELLGVMEHGEILALERGANGRVFGDAGAAEAWLRHGG